MRVLSIPPLVLASLAGVAGCGLVDDCRGPVASSVSLAISADLMARDRATRTEVCVAGGQCETRPLPSPPAPTSIDFTHVLPAQVARQGSDGPPVLITVVLYAGRTPVLTSRAEVGPVDRNPGNGRICHYKGYWIAVELRDNGTIGARLA